MLLVRASMQRLVAMALVAATVPCAAQLRLDVMPEATLLRTAAANVGGWHIIARGF